MAMTDRVKHGDPTAGRETGGRWRARVDRGFTMLELLIAVGVTTVGFAAIFAMQMASMQGNIAARELTGASNLAERYAEALRTASFTWTADGPPPAESLVGAVERVWHTLTPLPVDQHGLRLGAPNTPGSQLVRQRFCAHYWVDVLDPPFDGVINTRVRVIWPRASMTSAELGQVCPEAQAALFRPNATTWFVVTVPVTLRRHPAL